MDDHNRGMLGLVDNIQGGFVYARFVLIAMGLAMMGLGGFLLMRGKKKSSAKVKSLDLNQNKN